MPENPKNPNRVNEIEELSFLFSKVALFCILPITLSQKRLVQ